MLVLGELLAGERISVYADGRIEGVARLSGAKLAAPEGDPRRPDTVVAGACYAPCETLWIGGELAA